MLTPTFDGCGVTGDCYGRCVALNGGVDHYTDGDACEYSDAEDNCMNHYFLLTDNIAGYTKDVNLQISEKLSANWFTAQ